jgi:threonine/homoserine/homoserine lactone efflux protein
MVHPCTFGARASFLPPQYATGPTTGTGGRLTLDLVVIGLACSLEPIPLMAFILTLGSRNGSAKGLAFFAGWLISFTVMITLTLLATGGRPPAPSTAPTSLLIVLKIVIGFGLVVFAWRAARHPSVEHAEPGWMSRVDNMPIWTAPIIAFLVQPWGLVAAGAIVIAQTDSSSAGNLLALGVFAILASLSFILMESYFLVRPKAAKERLGHMRVWLDFHRSQVLVWISLLVGLWLMGTGIVSSIAAN